MINFLFKESHVPSRLLASGYFVGDIVSSNN